MIRRINLWGGPGSGKSTTAARLFSDIKQYMVGREDGLSVELVREFAKEYAWTESKIEGFDQYIITSEQLRREYQLLRDNRVDLIVTDAPLWMGKMYANIHDANGKDALNEIIYEFEDKFPSIDIIVDRGDRPYDHRGRYEGESDARLVDDEIKDILKYSKHYTLTQGESVFELVKNILKWD